MYYSSYLKLDSITNSQKMVSEIHDEHLFIIIHQAYELWFKQLRFELDSIILKFQLIPLPDTELLVIYNRLERCRRIWELLIDQVKIIESMTPMDFLDFRHHLYPASGFQSVQFRQLEIMMGIDESDRSPEENRLFNLRLELEDQNIVHNQLKKESLFRVVNDWLARMPLLNGVRDIYWIDYKKMIYGLLEKDKNAIKNHPHLNEQQKKQELENIDTQMRSVDQLFDEKSYNALLVNKEMKFSQDAILSALYIYLHRNEPLFQLPFNILNLITESDLLMTQWRQKHALLAQRMLGKKIGTGGSSGHEYLMKMANKNRPYLDLIKLSNYLLPTSLIPKMKKI